MPPKRPTWLQMYERGFAREQVGWGSPIEWPLGSAHSRFGRLRLPKADDSLTQWRGRLVAG